MTAPLPGWNTEKGHAKVHYTLAMSCDTSNWLYKFQAVPIKPPRPLISRETDAAEEYHPLNHPHTQRQPVVFCSSTPKAQDVCLIILAPASPTNPFAGNLSHVSPGCQVETYRARQDLRILHEGPVERDTVAEQEVSALDNTNPGHGGVAVRVGPLALAVFAAL